MACHSSSSSLSLPSRSCGHCASCPVGVAAPADPPSHNVLGHSTHQRLCMTVISTNLSHCCGEDVLHTSPNRYAAQAESHPLSTSPLQTWHKPQSTRRSTCYRRVSHSHLRWPRSAVSIISSQVRSRESIDERRTHKTKMPAPAFSGVIAQPSFRLEGKRFLETYFVRLHNHKEKPLGAFDFASCQVGPRGWLGEAWSEADEMETED